MKIFECDVEFESAEADEGSEDEVFDGTSDFDASASKIFRLIKDTSVLQRMEILCELPSNDLVVVMKKFQEKKFNQDFEGHPGTSKRTSSDLLLE